MWRVTTNLPCSHLPVAFGTVFVATEPSPHRYARVATSSSAAPYCLWKFFSHRLTLALSSIARLAIANTPLRLTILNQSSLGLQG